MAGAKLRFCTDAGIQSSAVGALTPQPGFRTLFYERIPCHERDPSCLCPTAAPRPASETGQGVKKEHTVLSSCLVSAPHYLDSSYLKQLSKQIFFKCYQCKEKVYSLFSEIFSHPITLLSSPVFFKS